MAAAASPAYLLPPHSVGACRVCQGRGAVGALEVGPAPQAVPAAGPRAPVRGGGSDVWQLRSTREHTAEVVALGRARRWVEALAFFSALEHWSLETHDITRNAALSALERGAGLAGWRLASQLLLTSSGGSATASEDQVKAMSVLASSLARGQEWSRASRLLRAARTGDGVAAPDQYMFSAAIAACGRGQQWHEAVHLLGVLAATGVEGVVAVGEAVRNAAISACVQGGSWKEALAVAQALHHSRSEPDVVTLSTLSRACQVGEQWALGLSFLEEVQTGGAEPDIVTHAAAVEQPRAAGFWGGALHALRDAERRIRGPLLSAVVCSSIVAACEACQRWALSLYLFFTLQASRTDANSVAFNAAIRACGQHPWRDAAQHLLQQMEKRNIARDLFTYTSLMVASQMESAKAVACLRRARADHVELTDVAYNAAIAVSRKRQEWDWTLAILVCMRADALAPDLVAYNPAIGACSGTAWGWAMHLVEAVGIAGPELDTVTLATAASSCIAGRASQAALHLILNFGRGRDARVTDYAASQLREQWLCAFRLLENGRQSFMWAALAGHINTAGSGPTALAGDQAASGGRASKGRSASALRARPVARPAALPAPPLDLNGFAADAGTTPLLVTLEVLGWLAWLGPWRRVLDGVDAQTFRGSPVGAGLHGGSPWQPATAAALLLGTLPGTVAPRGQLLLQ